MTKEEYIDDLDYTNGIVKQNKKLINENFQLQQENTQLKEDKKKVIEYIKENEFYLDYKTGACIKGVMPLLKILGGKSE